MSPSLRDGNSVACHCVITLPTNVPPVQRFIALKFRILHTLNKSCSRDLSSFSIASSETEVERMGNKSSKAASKPAVGMDVGTFNQIDVLEGEGPVPYESDVKMADPEIGRQDSKAPLKDNDDGEGEQLVCGVGPCRPRFLQWMAGGPKAFAFWSMLYLLIKTAGTVYFGAALNTIEKQFKLSSTESGSIVVLNDAVDMVLVMFVAYFGHFGHRPRIMAVGMLIAGIGVILCGIPHFLVEPYTNTVAGCNETVSYCNLDGYETCQVELDKSAVNPVWWLIIGQLLLGLGNVSVKPLGTTYIDDAVGRHTTAVYVAFLFIAVSIGPLMGFLFGSIFLSFFVDFDRVANEDRPTFNGQDSRYIGAWWLGFMCIGAAIMLISIPFFFFPRILPQTKERREEEQKANKDTGLEMGATSGNEVNGVTGKGDVERSEVKAKDPLHMTFCIAVKGMFVSYKRMLMNVGLLLLCLSSAMEGANAAALGTFVLKYYNREFGVPDSLSSLLAIIVFPFNLIGILVGGYIIRRKKWSPASCALFLLFGDVVAIVFIPVFLIFGCQTQAIAGVTVPYMPPSQYDNEPAMNITLPLSTQLAMSECNMNCRCEDEAYNPVCGVDNITYVSPCFAGCQNDEKNAKNETIYTGCLCIDELNAVAKEGECAPECQDWQVPVLIVVSVIITFCGGLGYSGLVLITLRIVEENMRSVALGFQSILLNLFGFLTAPIYFGALIDSTCILWDYEDGERGNCPVYDRDNLRYAFHGLQGGIKVVAALLFVCVYLAVRDPKGKKYKDQLEESNEQIKSSAVPRSDVNEF